ncbi:MAG: hypothetical protein K1000chlam2_01782 [Chlamydiae bacterium]|nr:hypothetical protein [Chlamydiota bacterium]
MKKTGFILVALATIQCIADENFPKFAKDDAPFDLSQKIYFQEKLSPSYKKYISLDLTAIPALEGLINVGIRNEMDIHGSDLGVGFGKGLNTTSLLAYGSWLRFFDASETAKYYAGIGLKGAHIWGTGEVFSKTLLAHGLISAGTSFYTKSQSNQFIEFNMGWPTIFKHIGSFYDKEMHEYKYFNSGLRFDLKRIQFALLYGLFF